MVENKEYGETIVIEGASFNINIEPKKKTKFEKAMEFIKVALSLTVSSIVVHAVSSYSINETAQLIIALVISYYIVKAFMISIRFIGEVIREVFL